jgi:hypothetical protein
MDLLYHVRDSLQFQLALHSRVMLDGHRRSLAIIS